MCPFLCCVPRLIIINILKQIKLGKIWGKPNIFSRDHLKCFHLLQFHFPSLSICRMCYLKCVLVEFNSGGVYKLIITAKYTYLFSLINLYEIFYTLIVSFTEIQPEKEK